MLNTKLIFIFHCAVVVSVLAIEAAKGSTYNRYAVPENGTCYKRVPYDEAVIANLSQGLIKTESTTPPPGIQTWITIIDCCDGYRRNYDGDCEFYCEKGCSGGNCTGPNECTCEDGWRAENGECRPACRQRCPQNSYCFAPNVCACLFGFEEIGGICQPICQHNCRNGDCVAPADCRCHRGYFLNETRHCEPTCENGCLHGFCAAPRVCSCDQGYVNQLYDSESCIPECFNGCVNGECVAPNVCTCNSGYQQTENGTCEAQCEEACPENGLCVAPNQCGCKAGFIMDIQGKNCIELPKNAQTYSNRGIFTSRNNQSQDPKRPYDGNNAYNTQHNRPYSNVDRSGGAQKPSYGGSNYPNGQGGVYQTDNPYDYAETEIPQGVIGLKVTTENPREGSYGTYQRPRPQRPFMQQGSYATSTPYRISGTREGIEISTTYRTPVNDPFQPDEPQPTPGPYGPYDSQTQNPWNNQNRNSYDKADPNGQRTWNNYPHQHQNPYDSRPSQGINRPYNPSFSTNPRDQEGIKTGKKRPTYEPQMPYSPTNGTLQGPFVSQSPHRFHTTQSQFQPDEPRSTVGPYGPHDSQTQSPWSNNQNGNFYDRTDPNGQQTWNSYPYQGQNPYDQHRPSQDINRPHNSYSSTTSRDQEGIKTSQRRPTHESQLPYSPHRPYNPYIPTNPYETQGVKTFHGRPLYGPQGIDQTYNPYAPTAAYNPRPSQEAGIYTSTNPQGTSGTQRLSTDIYSRSSVMHSNPHPGGSYSYGIDHLNGFPQNGRRFNGQQSSQIPEGFIVSDPYVQPETNNIGGIIIVDGPQIPNVNQLQPLCNGPCINSHCIGLNLCMCEIGFIPDPRNPNGNACVPFG